MDLCVRDMVGRAAERFSDGIDAAVLTTFTFSPYFFEVNVLPTLFGIERRGAEARRADVNDRLAQVPVAVFYDAAGLSGGGEEVRYQAWPIRLSGAGKNGRVGPFFHPKLVILAGRILRDGVSYPTVYMNCGSANLTLSGWGQNIEALAETWIDCADLPAHAPLRKFLTWLRKRLPAGSECPAIHHIIHTLKGMKRRGHSGPELYISGAGITQQSLPDHLRLGQSQKWDSLTVLSPYWSGPAELNRLLGAFNARQITLVPGGNAMRRFGLTPAHQSALSQPVEIKELARDISDLDRFAHAKMYFLRKERGQHLRVAIGSCNATDAALRAKGGNVEAMLLYSIEKHRQTRVTPNLKALDLARTASFSEEEEAPQSIPFDLTVVFDWKAMEYIICFHDALPECSDIALTLPNIASPLSINADRCEKHISCKDGPGKARTYSVFFKHGSNTRSQAGLISEINLDHSTRDYTPALTALEIIDGLRDPPAALARALGRRQDSTDDDTDATVASAERSLNLYDFYAALRQFRWRDGVMPVAPKDRAQCVGDLITRPSSLLNLARAVYEEGNPPVHRFAVILEISQILHEYRSILSPGHLDEIRNAMSKARKDMLSEISAGPYARMYPPQQVLSWFEDQLLACKD
jgi:hypothetical protein